MAFLVEDGTGLPDSNSYSSDDELIAYWLERNVLITQYTLTERQSALVLSTDHIDLFFGEDFFGYRLEEDQALEFPRTCIYDYRGRAIEGVPTKVKYATAEYAYRVLSNGTALVADPVVDNTGMQVQATFKKAGPLEKRITYTGSAPRLLPSYPKADAYLKEFTGGSRGGSSRA